MHARKLQREVTRLESTCRELRAKGGEHKLAARPLTLCLERLLRCPS
eukprot:SAG11_NODE_25970_length_351_cov_1.015873_1_plen_46_part_10